MKDDCSMLAWVGGGGGGESYYFINWPGGKALLRAWSTGTYTRKERRQS